MSDEQQFYSDSRRQYVSLSNGRYLIIEERKDQTISIASAEVEGNSLEVDYWICQITPDGVLSYGHLCPEIVEGLLATKEDE